MTAPRPSLDRLWIAVLVCAFTFGLWASWQRWGNPVIDTGREMQQPLRLAEGERLYADVRHIYGPFSPWLHAALFRVFGPSLAVLYGDGILMAALVIALIYWIGRRILPPGPAGAAALSVMFLCVFKPAGNYILPYSYNALHASAFGLLTLATLVTTSGEPRGIRWRFIAAGLLAGLTLLSKTESGLAAVAAGLTAAIIHPWPDRRRGVELAALFALPAAVLTAGVYGAIAAQVGWRTLAGDSWLLLYNVPPELKTYNAWISGFDRPLHSAWRVTAAALKLGLLAAVIAAIATLVVQRRRRPGESPDGPPPSIDPAATSGPRSPLRVLAVAAAATVMLSFTVGLDWDKGPYLAMPLLLIGLLATAAREWVALPGRQGTAARRRELAVVIVCAVYALVSLARMILHVRSGGAHAAYLLPVSVMLFTYLWAVPFARRFASPPVGRLAASIAVSLIAADAAVTAVIQAVRYRTRSVVPIETARGTMIATRDVGHTWNDALAFLQARTAPGEAVAVMPEGTSLTFLGARRNPLREEITTPGFLDAAGEARAIARLAESGTRLILVTNRPTGEFGPRVFGRDYHQRLMAWIESHYERCAMFGPAKDPDLEIGDHPFFVRAYCAR